MSLFIVSINGKPLNEVYTSLKAACDNGGVDYFKASRGTRVFITATDDVVRITDAELVKIKGRKNNTQKNQV